MTATCRRRSEVPPGPLTRIHTTRSSWALLLEDQDTVNIDDTYQMYGTMGAPRPVPRPQFEARVPPQMDEMQRIRVEKMERQLANLTGIVQKALQAPGSSGTPPAVAPRQDINYQRSGPERDRLKPAPPPKPAGLSGQQLTMVPQRTIGINVSADFFHQLRLLQKQSRDLRIELLTREEEIYRQDMLLLENDLYELEATVERLRGQAANRETRVNMADIERIAMVLSKSSKTVADWKVKFPVLQQTMKAKLASEMDKTGLRTGATPSYHRWEAIPGVVARIHVVPRWHGR
ncbi:putative actin [Operophtera brumata]|uniref:Putative actin n=1 Tax=Operophtera brumata TaxID=104452 RepID=A0A0L7L2J7_OPEBR|nr:putative actin [Operophtera brumata]